MLPTLQKNERTVDFGAGRCAYANMLMKQGYRMLAHEPHFQQKGTLNIREVVRMIKVLRENIRKHGLMDVVVLDSVLNSVVNSQFEHAVLTTCNALLKQDGRIYIGTRLLPFTERLKTFKTYNSHGRDIQFLDKENFGATYRSGVWTMQHFHTHDSLRNLLLEYFENVEIKGRESEVQLYAIASHPRKLPRTKVEKAINVEFNMEYPATTITTCTVSWWRKLCKTLSENAVYCKSKPILFAKIAELCYTEQQNRRHDYNSHTKGQRPLFLSLVETRYRGESGSPLCALLAGRI